MSSNGKASPIDYIVGASNNTSLCDCLYGRKNERARAVRIRTTQQLTRSDAGASGNHAFSESTNLRRSLGGLASGVVRTEPHGNA